MPTRVLLVPGTEATNLVDQAGRQVWNAVRATLGLSTKELGGRPPSEWRPLLSMQHTRDQLEPVQTSLEVGTTIMPVGVLNTPYLQFLAMGIEVWPYDWRADVRWNATLLCQTLKVPAPGASKWTLIGHSQGCLIILAASKLIDGIAFSSLVDRVILVAPPVAGTMIAACALVSGVEDLGSENTKTTRALARTWPSLYQMLPSWDAVVGQDRLPLPPDQQLLEPAGWPDVDDIKAADLEDMLARARALQQLLRDPFAALPASVSVTALCGATQRTPLEFRRVGAVLTVRDDVQELGDDLVPLAHTLVWNDGAMRAHLLPFDHTRPHAMLCEDAEIVDAVSRLLIPGP